MKTLVKTMMLSTLLSLLAGRALALDPIFTPWYNNLAIRGYDTVAYFTDNKAVEGKEEYETEWMGATWRFASQQHLEMFKADPEKYSPQFGGYCAYAVGINKTASVDPELFTIVDGKLYLNYNKSTNSKWLSDRDNLIKSGHQNWPSLLSEE